MRCRAGSPTRISPLRGKEMTEGVKRVPSSRASTCTRVPVTTPTDVYVVPKSIPTMGGDATPLPSLLGSDPDMGWASSRTVTDAGQAHLYSRRGASPAQCAVVGPALEGERGQPPQG